MAARCGESADDFGHGCRWGRAPEPSERLLQPEDLASDVGHLHSDILRERQAAWDAQPSPEVPVVVRDLRKEFPAQDGNPMHAAVKNLSLRIPAGECFGCAGPRLPL